jgi:chromosome segregation and condensation protein ScpB
MDRETLMDDVNVGNKGMRGAAEYSVTTEKKEEPTKEASLKKPDDTVPRPLSQREAEVLALVAQARPTVRSPTTCL